MQLKRLLSQPIFFRTFGQIAKLIAFSILCVASIVVQTLATFLYAGTDKNVGLFAIGYSLGLILYFLGSLFVASPLDHIKQLHNLNRIIPLSFYMLFSLMGFIAAIISNNLALIVFLIVLSAVSFIWYCLNFLPWG